MPVPLASNFPVKGLVPAKLRGAIMLMTACVALASLAGVEADVRADRQAVGTTLATGAQRLVSELPPGCPAAVETIRSVSGVMFTVCPDAVAIELRLTCLPPTVPVMLRM